MPPSQTQIETRTAIVLYGIGLDHLRLFLLVACPDEAEVGATSSREDEAGNRLSKRLKYEKGTAASLTKQLQVAQKVSLQRVAYLVRFLTRLKQLPCALQTKVCEVRC